MASSRTRLCASSQQSNTNTRFTTLENCERKVDLTPLPAHPPPVLRLATHDRCRLAPNVLMNLELT